MPYITASANNKTRLLLSGFPQSGKTTSFATFIYGPYDHTDSEQAEQAVSYADTKHMVILVCPGEFGVKSLPHNTDHITSYFFESSEADNINSAEWSEHAIDAFNKLSMQVIKDKPDILCIDGLHGLWQHLMNRRTNGDYLAGLDLSINPNTGRSDPYRSAQFHNQTHNAFGQYVSGLYTSSVPLIVCTTWEEWESGTAEGQKPGDIASVRYLWPAIPGKMAKEVVGKFDIRVSARLEKRCCHAGCELSTASEQHYVWQFLPKNDVMGVGIKGTKRFNKLMLQFPYCHANWDSLQKLIVACS